MIKPFDQILLLLPADQDLGQIPPILHLRVIIAIDLIAPLIHNNVPLAHNPILDPLRTPLGTDLHLEPPEGINIENRVLGIM